MTVKDIKAQLERFPDTLKPVIFNVSSNRFYEIEKLATIQYWDKDEKKEHMGLFVMDSFPVTRKPNV